MEEVIKLFKQIKETGSIKEKKAIIDKNKNNELFKECLKFLVSTDVVTGISTKKLTKQISVKTPVYLNETSTFKDVVMYLSTHNTGTDNDICEMQYFLSNNKNNREFYEQMITKQYRLGCDKKIVNSVIPSLIPEFNLMLGTSIEKCKLKSDEPISISQKINGCRCAFVGYKFMTRQGKEYSGLDHILLDLRNMGYENMFIDGELVYKNKERLTDSEAFQKGTGIAMSKDGDKSQLKLIVFDVFPLDEFWSGKSRLSYFNRKHTYLKHFQEKLKSNPTENLEVVPIFYEGTDHSQIWKWLDYAERQDYEGCMINLNTPYECKRTKNLIKVKKFFDITLRIVNVEEGTGRNKGRLGAITCKYHNNTVNIGSGFTDEQRDKLWKNRENIIGNLVDVKYKEITVDKDTGLKSLQFPTFICFRNINDKKQADDE